MMEATTLPNEAALREPSSVARMRRTFSQSLSAADLTEPLLSLDENQPMRFALDLFRKKNVSVIGVRRLGVVTGWIDKSNVSTGTVQEHTIGIRHEEVLDESASLASVLHALAEKKHVFIQWLGAISGVITQHDLQKAPLRMWLFGAITVLDSNLTWAIEELYPSDSWQGHISAGRHEKASALRAERQRRGSDCQLVDCLQIKDKADILTSDPASINALGFDSRRECDRLMRDLEMLRNHLAHAQELEPKHLATATRVASFLDSILHGKGVQQIVELRQTPKSKSLPG